MSDSPTQGTAPNMDALRLALFETLQGVKEGKIDLDRARSVNELGKTLIDSAKAEVDYLRVAGGGESEFLSSAIGRGNLPQGLPGPKDDGSPRNGITGVTRHLLKG